MDAVSAVARPSVMAVRPEEVSRPQAVPSKQSPAAPRMDEYRPEEAHVPTGLYWIGADEQGTPKICFDDPEADAPQKSTPDSCEELCTADTGKVDRELEQLRRERQQLEQQLNSETDETKAKELQRKLAALDGELSRKDNDAYRRRHTVFS